MTSSWTTRFALVGLGLLALNEFTPLARMEEAVGQENAAATQPAVAPSPAPVPVAPAASASRPVVDETALRYFARQGDTKRLETEIARLKSLYPDWTPPADPLAAPPVVDEKLDAMWKLYSEGRVAELRKAIADRQTAEPAWQPPSDLLQRLALAEARERIVNASDLGQFETVIRIGSTEPSLLSCDDLDILWRVAEAFARTDRPARAEDAYRYVLQNCGKGPDRLATVQKAAAVLPRAQAETLIALGEKDEFAPVSDDLARRAVAAGAQKDGAAPAPGDLARVGALFTADGKASDALLLGWYYLPRSENDKAAEWFGKARGAEDTAEASQGLALALIAEAKPAEAEEALFPWRDTSDETRATYLAAVANALAVAPPLPFDEAKLGRFAAEVARARDVAAAQQFGWYADALNQFETAAQWFTAALGWKADDEPSAYGLTLMRSKLGQQAGVREMQQLWRGRSERIALVGSRRSAAVAPGAADYSAAPAAPPGRAEAPLAPDTLETSSLPASPSVQTARPRRERVAGAPASASRGCASGDSAEGMTPAAALARGWCLMERNRPLEAAEAFAVARRGGSSEKRGEAAYGESLAYLRAGLNDRAAVAAASPNLDGARSRELRASLLAAQATGAFEAGRYNEVLFALQERARIAPERTDLVVLRGYAYLGLGRVDDARTLFSAAAATGNREARKGLGAIAQKQTSR